MNLNASTQSISQPMKNKGSTYAPDFPADCRIMFSYPCCSRLEAIWGPPAGH
jgi:hypothetical protein